MKRIHRAVSLFVLVALLGVTGCATMNPCGPGTDPRLCRGVAGAGLGAAAGAGLGAVFAGGKGAQMGALAGTAAGLLGGILSGQQQVDAYRQGAYQAELGAQQNAALAERVASAAAQNSAPPTVLFDTGSANIGAQAQQQLMELGGRLAQSGRSVAVVGYADEAGGNSNGNQRLSESRAYAVASLLERGGLSRDRIRAGGRGAGGHYVATRNGSANQQNRRVEIIIDGGGTTASAGGYQPL